MHGLLVLVIAAETIGLIDHCRVHHLLDRVALVCNTLRVKPVEARQGERTNTGIAREPL
jgi:hypothetical protein